MKEKSAWKFNGFLSVLAALLMLGIAIYLLVSNLHGKSPNQAPLAVYVASVCLILLAVVLFSGITIVQPNQARVIVFFGRYVGSITEPGIWMTVPFSVHSKVSLRVRNFNSKTLKVNDVEGNPIEIAAVIAFKVVNSAKALFDVDDYEAFVETQSETALRHVANKYPYDNFDETGISLRGNADEVAAELARECRERLEVAGVEVIEARLTHLAYATEIASAMLQRQQASAILAARQKIVEGAVGMAQMAIATLERDGIIELDEERKMAMINNLMVAIVSERGAQPVINAGSLY